MAETKPRNSAIGSRTAGVSWQIVPTILRQMLQKPDDTASDSVMKALLQMKKPDIAGLKRAYALRQSQE